MQCLNFPFEYVCFSHYFHGSPGDYALLTRLWSILAHSFAAFSHTYMCVSVHTYVILKTRTRQQKAANDIRKSFISKESTEVFCH